MNKQDLTALIEAAEKQLAAMEKAEQTKINFGRGKQKVLNTFALKWLGIPADKAEEMAEAEGRYSVGENALYYRFGDGPWVPLPPGDEIQQIPDEELGF